MQRHMNRRRFLELSASITALAAAGGALENFSPLSSEIAFAATVTRGITDNQPTSNWADAFLSGNGRYGIMVYGNPLSETVIFNDHKFEQPNGSLNLHPPVIANRLAQVQTDLLAGNYSTAQTEFAAGWTLNWTQPFHPGYKMLLTIPAHGTVSNYSRTINFETGEVTVQWSDTLGNWTRSSFVSRADNVVVHYLPAPSNGKLNVSLQLSGALDGAPSSLVFANNVSTDANGNIFLNLRVQYDGSANDPGYEGVTRVILHGGTYSISGTTLTISNANSLLLLTQTDRYDIATQWNNNALQTTLLTLPDSYTTLLQRHTAIHKPIFDRLSVNFNGSASDRALATTDLLNKQLNNPSALNPALLEKMFDAGRYHLLSSSGYFPTRLTGLWLGAWGAAWSDDFTTDANINLQVASGNIGNMPEVMQAFSNLIFKIAPTWQTNATNIYGTRGIFAPSRTDGTSSYEFHFDTNFPGEMWTGGADWLLYPIYEHYLVTGDTKLLKNQLWPWLEQLAYFYEDFLKHTDSNGNYIFVPSYSPENSPANTNVPTTIDATMDVAAGKHALQTAIDVATLLGVEQGSGQGVQRWNAILAKIPPYRVNSDGALAEWIWPSLTDYYDHRHISHLYPVWPLHEINPEDTPTLIPAATRALQLRGNPEGAAHGYLHRALAHARLKDGSNVSRMLLQILAGKYVFRSLMTSHYANWNTYNADSAHTIPAILMEMLTYSRPGVTELLPALPDYLTQGSINGVKGRNLVTVVSLNWNLATFTLNATLQSDITQNVTLISRRGIGSITSSAPLASSPVGSFARVISLQAGVSTSVSITLPASPFPGYYYIINRNSGMALDITGSSTTHGALAIQSPVSSSLSQQWQLVLQSDGSYQLINRNSGKVLDNPGSSTTLGSQLDQWDDNASSNQWWKLVDAGTGSGYYFVVNDRNGLYANVYQSLTTAGAAVIQWSAGSSVNQQWQLIPAS
jgi:alpha-L-fucosidase 2